MTPHLDNTDMQSLLDAVLAEAPCAADAIVWLQGDRFDRGEQVLALYRAGWALRIVVTGNTLQVGAESKAGEDDVSIHDLSAWLLDRGVPEEAIILDDGAMHCRDQAVHCLDLAQRDDWKTILLVASPYHQLRAYLTFLFRAREIGWQGRIVNQPAMDLPWDRMPSGRTQTAMACLDDEIKKIHAYKAHVMSLDDAVQIMSMRHV